MKSTVIIFKDLLKNSAYPVMLTALLLAVLYSGISKNTDCAGELMFSCLLPLFTAYYSLKSFKKAALSAFCLLGANLVLMSLTGICFSLLITALLTVVSVRLFSSIRTDYAFVCVLLISFVISVSAGLGYGVLLNALKSAAPVFKGRGALFGTVNNFYELAVSHSLRELFYRSAYSVAVFDGESLKTGVAEVLKGRAVSQYLTGKYFVNIPLSIGVTSALFKRVKRSELSALCAVCALSVVFGDVRLIALYIVLFNPLLYVAYLVGVFFSYLTASLLDLRIPLTENGSLAELYRFGNGWAYFIASSAVLGFLMYFLSRLVLEKFNINRGRYLPKTVRLLITALGGEDNLERFEDELLIVKNPNLIDILKIDCDIHQNVVSLNEDDISVLKEYYYESS